MAFIYTLTNAAVTGTDPAGTDLISLGDDNIRGFKSAMVERVNSRFVDVNADPWIIKSPPGGSGNTQSLIPTADNTYVLGEAARRFSDVRSAVFTGNLTGTVLTAAQANITSLGTLTSLTVSGVTDLNRFVNLDSTFGDIWIKMLSTGSGHYNWAITKSLSIANALQFTASTAADGTVFTTPLVTILNTGVLSSTGGYTGTLNTAAQPNVTSLGVLTGLNISGALTLIGAFPQIVVNAPGHAVIDLHSFDNSTLGILRFYQGVTLRGQLSADSSGVTSSVTVIAPSFTGNLTGTVLTGAQGNISSLGTLVGLNVGGTFKVITARSQLSANAEPYALQLTRSDNASGTVGFFLGSSLHATNPDLVLSNNAGTERARLTDAGTLSATAFSGPLTGNVTGNLTGTILTAAQANITSLGTLANLTVTASIIANGGLNMSNFVGTVKLIGGTTGVSHRNNADSADNLLVADNGDTTVRGLLLVSSGNVRGMTVSGLGNGAGAQITLAKVSTVGPPVANAAQQAWLRFIGSDGITYQVPAFT